MSDSGPYKIFISYRRDDSQATVDHIYDRLKDHFGRDAIFMDVDSIPPGYSFPGYVKSVLRQCRVALVVIGPAWLSVFSNAGPYKGQPRLADPSDFVRIEIEQTLALAPVNDDGRPTSDLLLMPVLVQGARMPHAEELPVSLRALAERNATQIRRNPDFDHDINRLITHINSWTATTQMPAPATAAATAPVSLPPAVTSAAPISLALPPDRFPPWLAELGFTAQKRNGVTFILPPVCAVPAGEFLMGSDPRRDSQAFEDEQPQHRVTLAAFSIGRFPVTVAEYACFVDAAHHRQPNDWPNQLRTLDHPVVYVSCHDAEAYATWLAKLTGLLWRLPKDTEWEKAARWDQLRQHARIYPWGDSFDVALCNNLECGVGSTTPVGIYPQTSASPYGAFDMAGNVYEWTDDVMLRGGSFASTSAEVHAASSLSPGYLDMDRAAGNIGFRLLLVQSGS